VNSAVDQHAGANLCHNYFDDHIIERLWRQDAFDVRTGWDARNKTPENISCTFPKRSRSDQSWFMFWAENLGPIGR